MRSLSFTPLQAEEKGFYRDFYVNPHGQKNQTGAQKDTAIFFCDKTSWSSCIIPQNAQVVFNWAAFLLPKLCHEICIHIQ